MVEGGVMAEQEAPEWWKEILPDRRFADGTPVCLIKDSRGVVAYDVGEPEADRILADHKAGQELVRVKADDTEGIDALQSLIADLRAQLQARPVMITVTEAMAELERKLEAAEAERGRLTARAELAESRRDHWKTEARTTTTLLQQAREALKKIEWTYNHGQYCQACGMDKPQHADDCTTALALAAIDAHVLASTGN